MSKTIATDTPFVKVERIEELKPQDLKKDVEYQVGDIKGLVWLETNWERNCLGFKKDSLIARELFEAIRQAKPAWASVNFAGHDADIGYFRSTTDGMTLKNYVKNVRSDGWVYGYWTEETKEKHSFLRFDISTRAYIKISSVVGHYRTFIDGREVDEQHRAGESLYRVKQPEFMQDSAYFTIEEVDIPIFRVV